ncbi:YkvA family protein [Lacticigenium naphthae]|uniref:YkvA family protein n=1 Tax=Lacticigenium naphthae TaxID=515351 RepID=UPI0003F806B8|nr:DUF1232 domain-containing protein [Lacticigenium naphthae]
MKFKKKQTQTPLSTVKHLMQSLFDTTVDKRRKWMVAAIVLYIISPVDLIPDMIPMVGYADDVLLPILLFVAEKLLNADDTEDKSKRKNAEIID